MNFSAYSEYKESGLEWLGTVPEHWSIAPLKFSASCNDTVLPDSTDDDYEIEYVEISDVNEVSGITGSAKYRFLDAPSRARRTLRHGDVLISTVRTYLRAIAPVVNPPENLIVSTGFAVVRPRNGILDGTFLGYLLRAEWWISEIIARSVGVSYPAINASDLISVDVPLPTWYEQTRIARFLDHETANIDALVKEQQRLIKLLKEKRQAVISNAVTRGLDPTVPMKESGVEWLGEVPAHWDVKALRRVIKKTLSNGVFKKKEDFGRGVLLVNVFDVYRQNFQINFASLDRVDCTEAEILSYSVIPGDLFFVRSSLKYEGIAVVAVAGECLESVVYECHLIRARPDRDFLNGRYGSYLFNSSNYRAIMVSKAKLTTMTTIDQEAITSTPIPIPPLAEQARISAFLDDETDKIDRLIAEASSVNELLKERRSAIISAAVTGKIDVRGWKPPTSALSLELEEEAV
jgi:type I restriction enzyme S subunit